MANININLKVDKNFSTAFKKVTDKYGEDFEYLNGFHESQMNFSDFIDGFVDKNVADVTIDANANASNKDIASLLCEKGKSHDKLFAFNKIFYEMNKKYGLKTAREWLETEYNGGFYLHDAPSTTYKPYCFKGDTKILTDNGIKRLDEIVGKDIKILNKNHGWENATVKHFGKDVLYKLVLERYGVEKEIYTTGNHVWYVKDKKNRTEIPTAELKVGMKIPFNTSKTWSNVTPSPFGVAHGFFTGDGYKNENRPRANFCGDKIALLPYFTPSNISGDEKEYTTIGMPKYFNQLPNLTETPSYLYGWLSGYFAADGCIDNKGRCTIASVNRDNLEFVRDVLCVLGMPVNEIRQQTRISNLTNTESTIYILTLSSDYLKEDFFILPEHKARFSDYLRNNDRKKRNWIVKSVENTGVVDDVYCAVAYDTHSFTLDNNVLTHNCYAYDITRLATEGLFFLKNYNAQPPKHFESIDKALFRRFDDVIEYVSYMCNRSSGAVGLPNLLIWSFYFWKKDCENGYYIKNPDYYLKQSFQKFIYRLNQPFLRVDQSSFTNVSIFDRNYIESLFGGVIFPDGTMAIDYVEELIEHQKQFMNVVSEIRSENMFTFPVLTYSLLFKDGKFVDEDFARWCSDHNTTWNDSNFFVSDNVGTLSNCCRLLSDTTKLDAFINSIGGTALSIGSVKVNTTNLMRIYYETGADEEKYLELLRHRIELCCKTLDCVRHIIQRNIEKGLLPNYCDGGMEMSKQYNTVGILGLYEVIEAFGYTATDDLGYVSYTEKGIEFASKIFDVINDVKDNFTNEYSINVESVPAERAAVILCQKDNTLYNPNSDKFIYSNQWIPLTTKCTIKEKLRLSSILDKRCGGGAIAHINLEANFPNKDVAWDMLNTIANAGVIYFAFNTRINECKNHHGFVGTNTCPNCGEGVYDTYQRVVGFLVPSRAYSKDRFKEFTARKWYDYAHLQQE